MKTAVTNEDLLRRVNVNTQEAAKELTVLAAKVDSGTVITSIELLPDLNALRNRLRAALSAVLELKNRTKQQINQQNK